MPQDRKTGAAWDWAAADYDSAHLLGGSGVAWDFLRRNGLYRQDWKQHGAGETASKCNREGFTLYRSGHPATAAQAWGLQLFIDPETPATTAPLFWQPKLMSAVAYCVARPADDDTEEALSLLSFGARPQVLQSGLCEHLVVSGQGRTANLIVQSGSILRGRFALTFCHDGFATAARHAATVRCLSQLMRGRAPRQATGPPFDHKYRDYLIALDGHLAGRSYRDIALVLYGESAVGMHWTDDTRWMKSRVRRAVERGIALMNGGYRQLL